MRGRKPEVMRSASSRGEQVVDRFAKRPEYTRASMICTHRVRDPNRNGPKTVRSRMDAPAAGPRVRRARAAKGEHETIVFSNHGEQMQDTDAQGTLHARALSNGKTNPLRPLSLRSSSATIGAQQHSNTATPESSRSLRQMRHLPPGTPEPRPGARTDR